MKKITTFLMMLLMVTFGFSQELPINFDEPSHANFVGEGGNTFEVIMDGTNSVGQTVGGLDQFNSRVDLALETYIDMTTANKTFTFEFYTSEAVVMTGLFQINSEANGGFPIEMQFTTDGQIGWETITLDFNNATNGFPNQNDQVVYGQYAGLSVFTNFGDTGTSTYWFDDIAGAANGDAVPVPDPVNSPATAAPTPPARSASDVISIYGSAYGTAVGLNNVPWDEGTEFTEETHAGEEILKIDFGVAFMGSTLGSVVDASQMTHFHIDYWVADDFEVGQVFNLKLSNHANNDGETNVGEYNIAFSGQEDVQVWKSVDIAIPDDFAGGNFSPRANITEFLITASGKIDVAYITNMYFYSDVSLSNNTFSNAEFKVYPNPSKGDWNIRTTETIKSIQVYNITGRLVREVNVNASEAIINTDGLSSGVYLAKVSNEFDQTKTIKLIKE
jgi:hypothetical protein